MYLVFMSYFFKKELVILRNTPRSYYSVSFGSIFSSISSNNVDSLRCKLRSVKNT